MRCSVYYHPDFAAKGYPTLKHRVAPGYDAVRKMPEAAAMVFHEAASDPGHERLLEAVHSREHIEAVTRAGFHPVALLSASSVIQAAEELAAGRCDFAFAFTGTAGHHAGRNYCWGFCYYNDAAMAVVRLREMGIKKIMIFDIDPHSGDGTRDILARDPDIIHINFFADENHSYEEISWHNYGRLLPHCDDRRFLETVQEFTTAAWDFEFLIVIFGHDGHTSDYGDFYLTTGAYVRCAEMLMAMAGRRPVLYVLSGGSIPQIAAEVIPAVIRVHANHLLPADEDC